ncbi:hypothetical protein ACIA8O_26265 [Kitasatospora sp. NPDC051853]|uniref:hypothetical protein n=1 Tax=Kitasatospora sp. NPDC051853 TaxID=3364058 RepID=UPI0037B05AC9
MLRYDVITLGLFGLVCLGSIWWAGSPPAVDLSTGFVAGGVIAGSVQLAGRPRYRWRAIAVGTAVVGAGTAVGLTAATLAFPDAAWNAGLGQTLGAALLLPVGVALMFHLSAPASHAAGLRYRHPLWYWGPLAAAAVVALGALALFP